MYLSHKVELKPNNAQVTAFSQHIGVTRHAWNWGLEECNKLSEQRFKEKENTGKYVTKFPTAIDLHKRLVAEVKPVLPWYYESSKCSPQESLRDLEKAFKRFFKGISEKPKFKKKGGKSSFFLEHPICLMTEDKRIKLPKIGWVRLKEPLKPGAVIKSVVIAGRAGRWFLSYKFGVEPKSSGNTSVVGVDLGISKLATLSTGETFTNKRIASDEAKLRRLQRQMSRRQKGSNRRKATAQRIAIQHYKLACKRLDVTHKLTSHLAKNHGVIVIEDLCVGNMLKNKRLAASIQHANFGRIRSQLGYKCQLYGSQLVVVDRWFPSSQICNLCGHQQKMPLSTRTYKCPYCGKVEDRDLNAAKTLAVSHTVTARENLEVTEWKHSVPGLLREEFNSLTGVSDC